MAAVSAIQKLINSALHVSSFRKSAGDRMAITLSVLAVPISDSVIQTESAREARKSFYCELCQKGYSRINEFEAHEGSYDHQHKKVCLLLYHLGCEA